MRLLLEMDARDYDLGWQSFVRHSARCITIRDGLVAMVRSRKYDYYKFPGGGIEPEESPVDALIRETMEESGLVVIPESIREYGYVHRIQKSTHREQEYFLQDNFYYLCNTEPIPAEQKLDDYEQEEGFHLCWVTPQTAIDVNRTHDHGGTDQLMLEREARVLELLLDEGYFS